MDQAKELLIRECFDGHGPTIFCATVGREREPDEHREPFEDEDALCHDMPFNRENARLEVYDQFAVLETAKRLAEHTNSKIKRLPNPIRDVPAYLRECLADADKQLDSCGFGREVVNHSRRSLAAYVEDYINDSFFNDTPPTCWAEFLTKLDPVIPEYRTSINLWIYIRWLQRMISHYEQISTTGPIAATQASPQRNQSTPPPQHPTTMEPRYQIDKAFSDSHDSRYFQEQIEADGFCLPIGSHYRVYVAPLAAFLTTDEVPVTINTQQSKVTYETVEESEGVVTQKPTVVKSGESKPGTISGRDYAAHYKAAYDEGRDWFIKEYGPGPAVLYGPHAKSYVDNLHALMYHTYCGAGSGLIGWKEQTINGVFQKDFAHLTAIGYRSGMIAEIEALESKHPHLFDDLTECRHEKERATDEPPADTYDSFAELFINSADVDSCVDELMFIEPPVLSATGNWIGSARGSKSIMVAFIERLEETGKIKRATTRKELVALLNAYFPGLDMGKDARLFGAITATYKRYKADFDSIILP